MPSIRTWTLLLFSTGALSILVTAIASELCNIDWEACYMRFEGLNRREYPTSMIEALAIALTEILRQPASLLLVSALGMPSLLSIAVARSRLAKIAGIALLILPAIAALSSGHDCDRKSCDTVGLWLAYFLSPVGAFLLASVLARRVFFSRPDRS
jgi:hypothetical protein